jgi:hypothetical protein
MVHCAAGVVWRWGGGAEGRGRRRGGEEGRRGEGGGGVHAGAVECAATATAATAVHREGGLRAQGVGLYRALLYK